MLLSFYISNASIYSFYYKKHICINQLFIISMLRTTCIGQLQLHHQQYVFDKFNHLIYYLKDGQLYSHHINTKTTKEVNINSHHHPTPTLKSRNLITVLGNPIINVDHNIISNNGDQIILRSQLEICDGISWQWFAPLSLKGIKLGVCRIKQNQTIQYEEFQFNSSTSRTITFSVHENQLSVLINGNKPKKDHCKTINYDSDKNKWYPYVKMEGKGNTIVYLPFSTYNQSLGLHKFNIFGQKQVKKPEIQVKLQVKSQKIKISNLLQISDDKFLILWQNNHLRIIQRNLQTHNFDFLPIHFDDRIVHNPFLQSQYQSLKQWRGQKEIFQFSTTSKIDNLLEWLRYLLVEAFNQNNYYIQRLILTKIAIIRPYAESFNLCIPNLIPLLELDIISSKNVLKYFDFNINFNKMIPASYVRSLTQYKIDGKILDCTQNYLLTIHQNHIIIYSIQDSLVQVFRNQIDNSTNFSKAHLVQSYEENDIQNLKNQSSCLYKILMGCLQKEKKHDEPYIVNENDIKQLIRDYGIDQASARTALQHTGHVEQALVWIFTDKNVSNLQKVQSVNEVEVKKQENLRLIQVENQFGKLMLQRQNIIFLLGVQPKQTRNWVYKGERQYIDLSNFKHQDDLNLFESNKWYLNGKHPKLSILDKLSLKYTPDMLYRQGNSIYYLYNSQGTYFKHKIHFDSNLVYQSKNSLSQIEQDIPFQYNVDKTNLDKTRKGQLICTEALVKHKYSQNTIWTSLDNVYDNIQINDITYSKCSYTIQETLPVSFSQKQYRIPLIVQSGPPGCNNNYSITSILQPNSSFLANYQQKVVLKHLHNKLFNLTSFSINRTKNRKNINFMTEGTIHFIDEWGNNSKTYHFKFNHDQTVTTINFQKDDYWKFIVITPNFTKQSKLPFEFGFMTGSGSCLYSDSYKTSLIKTLNKALTSSGAAISVIKIINKSLRELDLLISSNTQEEIHQACTKITNLRYLNKSVKPYGLKQLVQIQQLEPSSIIQELTINSTKASIIFRNISFSSTFSFDKFTQNEMRKFLDLALYYVGNESNQYFVEMFNKLWNNSYGQKYLLQLSQHLTQFPTIPLQYLKILISKLNNTTLSKTVEQSLLKLQTVRSKKYKKSSSQKLPYLLYQNEFYSKHYFELIEPQNKQKNKNIFNQPYIKNQIAVFKSQNSRKFVIKLNGEHFITNLTIKAQPCELQSKINYFVYAVNESGKILVSSNRILEHQWSYFTKLFNKPEVESLFESKQELNVIGLDIQSFVAQYIQIQFFFSETGIINHNSQVSKIPQVDIIPELYGYSTGSNYELKRYDELFVFNKEQLYFLSVSNLGYHQLQKYSVTKANYRQYIYFKLQKEDQNALLKSIQERIQKNDHDSLISLQKRLLNNTQNFSNKITLDYIYTLLALTFTALDSNKHKLNKQICEDIYNKLVSTAYGPIKRLSFRAISHNTPLLMKSLQYVEEELPSLGKIDFSYEQLVSVIDLNNTDLCMNLSRLIIRVVGFQPKWAQLLIKMSPKTQINQEIIKYFIQNNQWLYNNQILQYISSFSQQFFRQYFLNEISYDQLCKLVLNYESKQTKAIVLQKIIANASQTNPIDLDVVSLIFKNEDQLRWDQLQKVLQCCPQATDTIIRRFLYEENAQNIACNYHQMLAKASQPKYAEEFAYFLGKVYQKNQQSFINIFLSLDNLKILHYDFLQTITDFICRHCNFGGIEGISMLGESKLRNISAAVDMLKKTQRNLQGAQLPNEQNLLQWYLNNNDYQFVSVNPANRSPGYHLLRQLIEQVFNILKQSTPSNVLAKYASIVKKLKKQSKLNLTKKHLMFNKLHNGATKLLAQTLTPGSLAQVFVGTHNPLLSTVLNELKTNVIRKGDKKSIWKSAKQIDVTESFEIVNLTQQIKDLQLGKSGSKASLLKLPISQRTIRLSSKQNHSISKFIIGFCLNDHSDNKTAVFPSRVELFGGSSNSLSKISQLYQIQDQYYLSYGVKLFGLNLNLHSYNASNSIKQIELKIYQPNFSSVSQIIKNQQRSKKNATFNVSFISIVEFDCLPQYQPDYSELYVTLLGFLGQSKYVADLRNVVCSDIFDQKLQLIIQVLNDLLPNESIQNLLLSLNKIGQNVLENILRSKSANPRLVKSLILGKLTKQNISKLIAYTLQNISQQFVNILVMSLRLSSYEQPSKGLAKNISDFNNIQNLLQKYETNMRKNEGSLYYQILTSLLTIPNIFNYDISKFVQTIMSKPNKRKFYILLSAILPYHPIQLENFLSSGNTVIVFEELIKILQNNQKEDRIQSDPIPEISFINSLSNTNESKQKLIQIRAPIKISYLLQSKTSLLLKYSPQTMKQFISFFQNTCIKSSCQDQFSQILINLMTSLNNFQPIHHQYFIQNFFFPLINAFEGVHLFFVWKQLNNYIWQPTQILKTHPIKSSSQIINKNGKFYEPTDTLQEDTMKSELLIVQNKQNRVLFKLQHGELTDAETNKKINFSFKQSRIVLQNGSDLILPNENHTIYQLTTLQHNLLTNATLLNLKNPWLLQQKYRAIQQLKSSTSERCYFVPLQMKLSQILKQINISGFKIHPKDIENIKFYDFHSKNQLTKDISFRQILKLQKVSFVKVEIQASSIFKSVTVESLATQSNNYNTFVTQQTIFKAFEEKKGLQKLITVLTGCIKNWGNIEQSKIWGQYLKQLQSYSCFPVFSSLYMTKEANVKLLFDLLLGLPDKQDSKIWLEQEKVSVKELYSIIKDVFSVSGQNATIVRKYALNNGFYSTMLNRLHLITKQPVRIKTQDQQSQEEALTLPNLEKKDSEEQYKNNKLKKKKGVGYGTDSSTNQKWDVTSQQQTRKQQSQQILGLLKILQKFFDTKDFEFPISILDQTYQSALLPIIQSSLRGGSLLEISKYAQLFQGELNFIQILCKCKVLVPTLIDIPKIYEPKQPQSLQSLLKTLANTSKIFLSCLTGSASQKVSQQIATNINTTYEKVEQAVLQYQAKNVKKNVQQEEKKILQLPLGKKYPLLLKDLRFDYIDMKDNTSKITKHHYASYYNAGHKSPIQKTIRLAQQLADISHALPIDHTNAIFVRCDKERVDYMQALIMGSNGTPYGHGAYLFDIYFQDTYPNAPPKVNLTTTGSGQIRFNPNLYACGKVCLSLLGTWRGNAMENWDAKVSTLLQVLVSIQSIIMSQDIYFNEPGFEHEQGTPEGDKKNEAYANIVRYGNVKFAMLQNIKKPPKGFETVIRRHFYLKKEQILAECQKWIKLAQKRQASYNGLVNDHNYNWCASFKKSKTEYKTLLQKAVQQLQIELNKLPSPTNQDFKKQSSPAKIKKVITQNKIDFNKGQINLQQIDVSYGGSKQYTQLDINDEKVKDRWSRYIGAMGVQAVSKQSKANIVLFGLGGLGVQIAKNIVLGGCKQFSIVDQKIVDWCDLSGQFFLGEADIGKSRLESTIYKLQQLNHYVKVSKLDFNIQNLQTLSKYQVVITTELNHQQQLIINQYCRNKNIKFISADCFGVYGQIFNDFGNQFQVIDKNGQEPVEVFLEEITNQQIGVVKMAKGLRHPFQDNQTIRITGVKGMKSLTNQNQTINGTLHKIKVINQFSFSIGNTLDFSPYQGDGIVRNIKTPSIMKFKSLLESSSQQNIDPNLQYYDYTKGAYLRVLHYGLLALSIFRSNHKRLPLAWNKQDAEQLIKTVQQKKQNLSQAQVKYLRIFSYTCSGNFGPMCAFFGGIAAQEIIKAITGKYNPINQYYLADFSQVIQFPPDDQAQWQAFVDNRKCSNLRTDGIIKIIGKQLLHKLQNAKVFMVGSGAIGCQLLKNYAMLEIGTGQDKGSIIVTDPDHIETSNLNRQFLFREKHLRKPKSTTAAAAVIQMNPRLKGHIKARLDKVCQATKDIFTNDFFETLTIVTNALDNVEARRYVDSRCVDSKIALLESGTLSSKGHVQVIIPYKTQTYGSKQDPNDANGQIPHCTLKMFPEQILHCIEWARDLFGKEFTLSPKALAKLLQAGESYVPSSSDIQMLKDCVRMLQNRPTNFQQAIHIAVKTFYQIYRNDIKQLLYTYPLDAKTKDGKLFWRMPKRPPTPIEEIDAEDPLHSTFITSYAVLLSKIYKIPYPKDFREPSKRLQIAKMSKQFKIQQFVASDKLAKQMTQQVNNQNNKQNNTNAEQQTQQNQQGQIQLYQKFNNILNDLRYGGEVIDSKAEEFQKDEDGNGHIDLIYSMSNLRARNYKLQEAEWINVKLKAGRIMAALSTTTSCIAALQTIQLVKYIKGCQFDVMRNAFINLAVPVFQLSEPGEVQKIKVHQNLNTNLWERWSINLPFEKTLAQLINAVQQKYGVTVKGLDLIGGGQVYSDIVLSLQSKKEEKQKLLSKSIKQILSDLQFSQPLRFVDFLLLMAVGENLIKHAPTLRLTFQQ